MRSNLSWPSDEQWRQIEPHLPTDVRGRDRMDDRRVISGTLHVLKSGCQSIANRSSGRARRSTISSSAGRNAVCERLWSASLPLAVALTTSR